MRFDDTPPPARRATDRHLTVALLGVAGFGWAAVTWHATQGRWIVAVAYSVCTLAITYGAGGMLALVLRYRRIRRQAARRRDPDHPFDAPR